MPHYWVTWSEKQPNGKMEIQRALMYRKHPSGRSYPYSSERQNTRRERQAARAAAKYAKP